MALRKLGPATNPAASLPWDTVRDALDHMVQAAASYVDGEHFLVLWESLQVRTNTHGAICQSIRKTWMPVETGSVCVRASVMVMCACIQVSVLEVLDIMEGKREEAAQATDQLERLLFIFHTLVSHRDGAKVTKPEATCQVGRKNEFTNKTHLYLDGVFSHFTLLWLQTVLRLIRSAALSVSCSRLLLQILSSLLLGENIILPRALIQETVQKVAVCLTDRNMHVCVCSAVIK